MLCSSKCTLMSLSSWHMANIGEWVSICVSNVIISMLEIKQWWRIKQVLEVKTLLDFLYSLLTFGMTQTFIIVHYIIWKNTERWFYCIFYKQLWLRASSQILMFAHTMCAALESSAALPSCRCKIYAKFRLSLYTRDTECMHLGTQ